MIEQGWNAGGVDQHSDSVWYFDATGKLGSVSLYLSDLRPNYIVILERHSWLQDLIGRSKEAFRQALGSLERAVIELGGTNPRWFKTYDAGDLPRKSIDEVMRA